MALYHGEEDTVVPVSSARRFEAALREAMAADARRTGPALVARYPSCSHLDYLLDLVTTEEGQEPPLVGFLREASGWSVE